jgi:hypothetical protein
MTLPEVLRAITGLPQFVAMRPTGIMLVMNTRQRILKIGRNGPHGWQPSYGDVVALDWAPFSPEQMAQMRAAAAQADAEG